MAKVTLWGTLALAVGLLPTLNPCRALDMNVAVDGDEKLVYVNMWGKVEQGDDAKFKALVLPLVRTGHLIFKVNVFTTGGHVQAAMRIGDQIRTLQAITEAPSRFHDRRGGQWVQRSSVECWFYTLSHPGGTVSNGWPGNQIRRDLNRGAANSWCECASACFLIWASGVTRGGNYVGIHRFRFEEAYFASLPVAEARTKYAQAEADFRAYLKKLDIPETILDRLFATDSKSMYYLTKSELELVKSTPYLEELTEARCGPDKSVRSVSRDGWSTKFDNDRIVCYRSILKELMTLGAKEYLRQYGG